MQAGFAQSDKDCAGMVIIDADFLFEEWENHADESDESKRLGTTIEILSSEQDAMCVVSGESYIELTRSNLQDVRMSFLKSNAHGESGKFPVRTQNGGEVLIDPAFLKYITNEAYYCYGLPVKSTIYKECEICHQTYMVTEFYYPGFNNGQVKVPSKRTLFIIGAGDCPTSDTGNCDNHVLEKITGCGDPAACDRELSQKNNTKNNSK